MNDMTRAVPNRALARQLLEVLRLRQAEAPTTERATMIADLTATAESDDELATLPDVVELVERSSLGTSEAWELRRRTPSAIVADVLARAARIAANSPSPGDLTVARGEAVPAEGPIADWFREVQRLRVAAGFDQEKVLVELECIGIPMTADKLTAALTMVPVCPDRELVRSIITVLGGDWPGRGYEASYDAALHEQRRLDGRLGAATGRQDVSGLAGADPLTPSTLLQQVQAEYNLLPDVRGRDDLVGNLVGLLEGPTTHAQVLVGEGGSGKSTVALAVAAAARDRGHLVWWVTAGDPNQVTRGMLAVATQLGAPVAELNAIQSTAGGADLLWRRLDARAIRWLLVFDDADAPDVLAVRDDCEHQTWIRPSPAGTIIVTSRLRDAARWGGHAALTEVGDLPAEAGALVVLDRIPSTRRVADPHLAAHARTLSERLGGVALALRIVGTYLESPVANQNIAQLATSLGDNSPPFADVPGRLASTWELVMSALADRGAPEARTVMRLLACYAPHWVVPHEVLAPERLAGCGLPVAVPDTGEVLRMWQTALDGLQDVGLVDHKVTAGQQVAGIVMHPMVAEVSRAGDDADVDQIEAAAVALLLRATEALDAGRPADWPTLRRLEPHVYALLDNLSTTSRDVWAAALELANRIAEGLIRAGLFALGEALIRHAQSRTRELGPQAPESLDAEHTLAWALGLRGELAEAEQRFRRLLLVRHRIAGPKAPGTLGVRDHLAWTLAEQGRLDEAYQRFRDLLPVCEEVLGADHRDTLAVRHRIAWITGLRGWPAEAEEQLVSLLPQRARVLGADHMEVFSTRYRLAWARCLQGRLDVAESDFVDILKDLKRVFDPDSAPVIMVYARLGWVRTWLGRFTEAEADYRHVLETRTRVLGEHHPRTLRARHDLAWVFLRRGDHRGAERLFREVLTEVERSPGLGKDHPLSLEIRGRLTGLLVDSGRLDEAERSARALVTHRQRVSGPDHPATLITRHTLARTLVNRGQYTEAERRLEAVLRHQEQLLGRKHRHTLETRATMAELIGRRGKLHESHEAIVDVLKCLIAVLGQDHPNTLASREQLVWILGEMDRLVEAETHCSDLIADRTRVLGALHPDTLAARYRLGWLFTLAERGPEAEQTYRALMADQHRVLGREHPHTLRSRHGLANELLRSDRLDEAVRELRSVLLDRIHLLGRTHPDTLTNRHSLALALALQGLFTEAELAMKAVLHEQLAALGPDHRHTLATRERLGWIQAKQGKLEVAFDHWRQLLSDRERVLGPEHPDTVRARKRLESRPHEVPRMW